MAHWLNDGRPALLYHGKRIETVVIISVSEDRNVTNLRQPRQSACNAQWEKAMQHDFQFVLITV